MNQFVKKTTAIAALLIGSCLGASAVPPPGPDAPAPNWLRHDNLTTLSVEDAKAIMEREGRVLSLDGLQELSPDAAKVLAGFKGEELDLMGLKTLPAETAKALAGCKCDLGLNGLAAISDEAAGELGQFKGGRLFLKGLTKLSPAAAKSLAGCKGKLFLSIPLAGQAPPAGGPAHPDTVSSPTNDTPKKGLAAIKVDGNSIAPEGVMDLPGARKLIIGRLEKDGVKGDIDPAAKISEITTKESWENAGIQLYRVRVDYAWLDGVAVILNKECLAVLNGRTVFLADLDKDDRYEIYTNFERGSGIISLDILGYNIALKEKYSLSMRFKKDLELFIENGALMARLHPPQQNRENNAPVGKVTLKINRGKRELAIE